MQKLSSLLQPALAQIKQNAQFQNNPMAQGMLDVIESGDAKKGEQMALNLCESMGIKPDDAIKQAKHFFNVK